MVRDNKGKGKAVMKDDVPILDEVVFKIHKNGYFEFHPLSSTPFSTRIKRKCGKTTNSGLRKKVKAGMVDDEPVGRKSIQTSHKGKEIIYELPGSPTKESQVVTNYKRTIVNGKAKMVEVEDVCLVQEKVSAKKVQGSTVKVCQLTCSVL
ncbi:hypothetical protein Tco_0158734 [Tanacetum coccineum]